MAEETTFTVPEEMVVQDLGVAISPSPAFPPWMPEEADGFLESISAGWQSSTGGLIKRQRAPEVVLDEEADLAERISFMLARTAGDLPTLAIGYQAGATAGGIGGGTVGSAVSPGAGTAIGAGIGMVVGGGGGAMALTEGTRAWLMDQYTDPEVNTFENVIDRLAISGVAAAKGAVIGGATAGTGRFVGGSALVANMPAMARHTAVTAAELTVMTTTAAGLEGELPRAEDFIDGAILLGGLKVAGATAPRAAEIAGNAMRNLRERYVRNAEMPRELGAEALVNANLRAKLISEADAQIARDIIGARMNPQKTLRETLVNDPYTAFVDDLNPLKLFKEKFGGKDLTANRDPYKIARVARGLQGAAAARLGNLTRLLPKDPVFREDLKTFLIANRAVELEARGIQSGVADVGAMKRIVKAAAPEMKAAAKQVRAYQNTLVKDAARQGLISAEQAKAMIQLNRAYIPFKRLFSEDDGAVSTKGGRPFKQIKGSERKIQDPYESIVENTISIMRMIEQNRVAKATVGLKGFPKVPGTLKVTKLRPEEAQKLADDLGVEALPELSIFRRETQPLRDNEIATFEGGKRTVHDVGKELATAVRAMDPYVSTPWMNVLAAPARLLRALTVISPDFIVRNFFRDQITAGTFTKSKFVPFVDFVRGFTSFVKQDKFYQQWRAAGGENTAMLASDRMLKETFSISQPNPWNSKLNPYIMLRNMSESVENATRIAEFTHAIREGATATEAAFRSREVTLDFARRGQSYARTANQLVAFLNVQIQGVDRFARAVKADPKGTVAKMAMYVTLPSISLWLWNHDKEWYKEIPQWQKDMFWVFSPDDGETVYRIPKPHEIGIIFGSIPERILDSMFDHDEEAMGKVADAMWKHFVPDFIPTGAAPFMETEFNRTFHTDAPVVRRDVEDLLPEYQYTEYTSPVAKALGELIGYTEKALGLQPGPEASPQVIEHFWGSWTGSMGRALLDTADLLIGKFTGGDPSPTLADIPFVKAFVVRHPSGGAESIKRFMDRFSEIRTVARSIDSMIERGEADEVMEIIEENKAELIEVNEVNKALSEQRKLIRQIWSAPKEAGIKPDEKRQMIDELYRGMILTAQQGLESIRLFRESIEQEGIEVK